MPFHGEEKIWVGVVAAMTIIFLGALAYAAWVIGLQVPGGDVQLVDPQKALTELRPGVREIAPGRYEVTVVGRMWQWFPRNITLVDPVEVKFRLTALDVIHGFQIVGTNVNVMVFPGYVAEITWKVPPDAKGTYLVICNEYCGLGHHEMYGFVNIIRTK
ncbi:cytochrome c oxidase subunit II [Pyrobaculum aerophilum]|uniref:Cytochrome C oxidase subunit II n=2 Tax=Pyrobaculum aerophilum TaxID=13773 RepID=Q8ZXC2_PYRAE|nr:cytochrome c oxidase subunit II [Pyrobaculum aerophilum]AAL63427.1 cytochrome C oxidase subunit II [Pyrobaculum aerophilum str. IM2]MCX8135668.1 cytochrome c oxidase subunit II [Pyrobaculum aerophilum]HII45973.1 cytochrome C oxidase subunit II [Pyrobaculum aerophilum]